MSCLIVRGIKANNKWLFSKQLSHLWKNYILKRFKRQSKYTAVNNKTPGADNVSSEIQK